MQSCYTSHYRESDWCKVVIPVIPATIGNLIGAKLLYQHYYRESDWCKVVIPATIGNLIGAKLLYQPL